LVTFGKSFPIASIHKLLFLTATTGKNLELAAQTQGFHASSVRTALRAMVFVVCHHEFGP
jgi:phosphotransferase system HPr-like phosphotransfer protein